MELNRASDASARFNRHAKAKGWEAYCKPDLTFCNPALNDLLSNWRQRAHGSLPRRSDITARDLKDVLRFACIMEKISEADRERWYFRLIGSGLAELLGDITGKYLDEVMSDEFAERWSFANDCALSAAAHLRVVAYYQLPSINYLAGQTLILPLADDQGEARFLLSCTYVRPKK